LGVFRFQETQKVAKSHSLCVQSMVDWIPDENGLDILHLYQEMDRLDSHSETEESNPRSERGGPRLGEYGKSKAKNKSAG
jgi:hypothetical protein